MTQNEIIRMAREAGFEIVGGELRLYFDGKKALLKPNHIGTVVDGLKTFAALVAAHEREKLAEQEPVIECDCETSISSDGSRLTKCGSDQMRRAVEQGHAFCKQQAEQEPQHSEHYWQHEINNARADGYERGYVAAKKLYAEQAEQEPVALALASFDNAYSRACKSSNPQDWMEAALLAQQIRTAPVRTKDLTDDEIWDLWESNKNETAIEFYEAIIAAYKEKNK